MTFYDQTIAAGVHPDHDLARLARKLDQLYALDPEAATTFLSFFDALLYALDPEAATTFLSFFDALLELLAIDAGGAGDPAQARAALEAALAATSPEMQADAAHVLRTLGIPPWAETH